jgi:SNF2 family DNA or RNA helicase
MVWLLEVLNGHWPFGKIIPDEATKLKGFRLKQGTKRSQALAQVAFINKRFTELSGTPAPNGLQDLWGQAWFLDAGERLGRNHDSFKNRWFQRSFTGYGMDPLPFAQKEIQGKLKDICISLNTKDYFDIAEPIESIRYIDLPTKARVKYEDMEKDMFMELGQYNVEAFNAASRTQKCLQVANGAAYVVDDAVDDDSPKSLKWYEVHDQKLQALDEIFEEAAGMPVLVAYSFKSDLARLKKAFPRGRVLDKNPQTIKDWNAGLIPYLFAHPQSAGHGLNLQDGGNILAFFSSNWNLEHDEQIKERLGPVRQFQAGHDRPVYIYRIIARDTVEEDVLERLKTKKSVQDILLAAMKRKGFN